MSPSLPPSTHTPIHTGIRILQAILEPGESWAQGVRELEEDLVHDQDGLPPEVGLAGAHQSQDVIGQVPEGTKGEQIIIHDLTKELANYVLPLMTR